MTPKTNINGSNSNSITIERTFTTLLWILCWSLIPHQFVFASTTFEADKIHYKSNRASYYASGGGPPSPSFAANKRDGNRLESATETGMPEQLIYELAIEHKHIPRVSLLTCQHRRRLLRGQTRTSFNIDTLTVLRTLLTGKDNRRYKGYNYTSGSTLSDRRRRVEQFLPKGVLIKVLRIDLLVNGQLASGGNGKRNHSSAKASEVLGAFLRSEVLRQFVVLDLSCGLVSRRVIEMASNKGLFNSSYHWLLIEDYTFNRQGDDDDDVENDSELPQDIVTAGASSTGSKARDNKINNDGDDDNNGEVDNNVVVVASQSSDNAEENNLLIEKFLEKINININTELILAKRINGDQDSKEDYYMLYDVWNPGFHYGGSLNITEIGKFSKEAGLQFRKWYRQTTTIIRRMDMKNARIRCMIVVTNKNRTGSLEDYLTQQYDTHLDSMHRFNFALLSHVRDLFNFSLVLSRTASWGYLKNGKFDGMIGALVRQQADIGGSPIFFRIERAKVIDYTARTWIARPCFVFRHPRTMSSNRIVFLQPFTNDVWILVAICGAVTVVFLATLTVVERSFNEDSNKSSSELALHPGYKGGSQQQQYNRSRSSKDANRKGKKRQIDIEVSSFTQKDALPLAQYHVSRHFPLRSTRGGGASASNIATTLSNEGFNTRAAIRKGGQVPADRGGVICEQSAIDCIDYGAGVSGPINAVFLQDNDIGTEGTMIKRNLQEFFIWWAKRFYGKNGRHSMKKRVETVLESMLFYIGAICQQGLSFSTNLFSGRCIVITSLLFSFCIFQFYSASIVGTLLMEKPKTIKTLRDMVHSSLDIGIEDIIYNREYFLRTRDPDAIELYAKKVSATPPNADQQFIQASPSTESRANGKTHTSTNKEQAKKNYKSVIHSHESGAHAKATEASNWYDPEYGVAKIKQGGFAFHVEVATAYKIISDTFTEKEICELSEIQLFPPQKMVNIVQKGSPLRKIITYGLRRTTEAGLMDYQRKVWHSPKPRCVKQIHTDDLRVDMQTFTSAVFVLIFGFAASVLVLAMEMVHNNLWQYFAT